MNLFVANIPFTVKESELHTLFSTKGTVKSAKIIMDKVTNKSRGFAFVEMGDEQSGKKAIQDLHGHDLKGRAIVVKEATPRD